MVLVSVNGFALNFDQYYGQWGYTSGHAPTSFQMTNFYNAVSSIGHQPTFYTFFTKKHFDATLIGTIGNLAAPAGEALRIGGAYLPSGSFTPYIPAPYYMGSSRGFDLDNAAGYYLLVWSWINNARLFSTASTPPIGPSRMFVAQVPVNDPGMIHYAFYMDRISPTAGGILVDFATPGAAVPEPQIYVLVGSLLVLAYVVGRKKAKEQC